MKAKAYLPELLGSCFKIPFPSSRSAKLAYDVLSVDDEPPRSQVSKTLSLNDSYLNG